MENNTLESLISKILEKHRNETFRSIEKHMLDAYSEIAGLFTTGGMTTIPERSVNGISVKTLKDIWRKCLSGRDLIPEDSLEKRRLALEFIKARSLAFETQRLKYPNYLKPWKQEDDLKLVHLWREGVSERELANIFQRNLGAIRARLDRLIPYDEQQKKENAD